MTEPAKTRRRRWLHGIVVVALLIVGAFVVWTIDPLNSVERGLVGVWKERTPRRTHDVLAFAPDRRYFVNNELTGTWRAVDGRLQVTPVSMRDVPMPLMYRLYFFVIRRLSTVPSKPVVTAAITMDGPDEITLRPEPGTDETTFDRVPGAQMPEVPRFDEDGETSTMSRRKCRHLAPQDERRIIDVPQGSLPRYQDLGFALAHLAERDGC